MSRYIDADKLCENLTNMAKYQEPYKLRSDDYCSYGERSESKRNNI